jgi:hypothetical protein
MTQKELTKAIKIHERIKALDQSIIAIEKSAMEFASLKSTVEVSFKFKKDVEEKQVSEQQVYRPFSLTNSLMYQMMLGGSLGSFEPNSKEDANNITASYDCTITETEALQMLAIVLYSKQQEREQLIHSLQSIGIEI